MKGKIGILGGLGPEATIDLYKKIVYATPAVKDQEHIETIIISNPKIPDRTAHICNKEETPVPEMLKTIKELELHNVSSILIPCNTAHHFLEELQNSTNIKILNMVEETVKEIKEKYPNIKKVGLLATDGTNKSKIYENELKKHGLELILPTDYQQKHYIMEAIYGKTGIKAGFKQRPKKLLEVAALHLQFKGADVIIKGCTEIALALKSEVGRDEGDFIWSIRDFLLSVTRLPINIVFQILNSLMYNPQEIVKELATDYIFRIPLIDPATILADRAVKHYKEITYTENIVSNILHENTNSESIENKKVIQEEILVK
jgi:aspartate racemase